MGTEEMWPYLLAVSGIPALLQLVTLPFFPEAPRYLYIDKGDTEGTSKGEWTYIRIYTNIQYLKCETVSVSPVSVCESLAVAVAGRRLEAGAGRHAEREGELAGGEGQDSEGCSHLSLCEVAAPDSGHPLCWRSVLRNQRCTFGFPLHNTSTYTFTRQHVRFNSVLYFILSSSCISTPLTSSVSQACQRTRCITWPSVLEQQSSSP